MKRLDLPSSICVTVLCWTIYLSKKLSNSKYFKLKSEKERKTISQNSRNHNFLELIVPCLGYKECYLSVSIIFLLIFKAAFDLKLIKKISYIEAAIIKKSPNSLLKSLHSYFIYAVV